MCLLCRKVRGYQRVIRLNGAIKAMLTKVIRNTKQQMFNLSCKEGIYVDN